VIRAQRLIPAVLADVVRKAPLCPEKVTFAWNTAVGTSMQRVTSVHLDAEGVLHVTALDAHWAREVRRSSRLILARVATLLGPGVVRELRTNTRGPRG
jgi:predicted nucleic acid-binding Zn ribbon protein